VDETLIFHSLSREQIRYIVELQLDRLRSRLAERKITLNVTTAAEDLLGEEGYDPAFGARPLRRVIRQRIENPLAARILEGETKDGDTVTVDTGNGGLSFK
jgi:ATP-dependent Clp protease ATP-binding subunit ClpB